LLGLTLFFVRTGIIGFVVIFIFRGIVSERLAQRLAGAFEWPPRLGVAPAHFLGVCLVQDRGSIKPAEQFRLIDLAVEPVGLGLVFVPFLWIKVSSRSAQCRRSREFSRCQCHRRQLKGSV
jgi:hypothetical protein